MNGDNGHKPEHPTDDEAVIDERAAFTRRSFLAATGGAIAAAALTPSVAEAQTMGGGGSDPLPPNAVLRIHPSIGFARVGNAQNRDSYFIGPELPGYGPLGEAPGTAVPAYKTASGEVKPQAARFRLWEYRVVNGKLTPHREVNLSTEGVANITWRVHLANKKASFHSFEGGEGDAREGTDPVPAAPLRNASITGAAQRKQQLEFDFGPRTISGASQSGAVFDLASSPSGYAATRPTTFPEQIDYLGELRTDAAGRLIVIGGKGKAAYNTATQPPMPHWANNDGWFDDAADGPVTVSVTLSSGQQVQMDYAGAAWVLSGPPDFAPGIPCSVTAWDLLFDLAVRKPEIILPTDDAAYEPGGALHKLRVMTEQFTPGVARELPTYVPSFPDDIQPILVASYNLWWVNDLVTSKHNSLIDANLGSLNSRYDSMRRKVLSYMRPPLGVPGPTGPRTMPKLMGDDPYLGGLPDQVRNLPLTHVQYAMLGRWADRAFTTTGAAPVTTITPHGLDRAALENCVGGAFYPGIEFGWQMRNPDLFVQPFRITHLAEVAHVGDTPERIGPGHFSRQMAVPWQADFNDCRNEGNYGWWPSQRPAQALPSSTATRRVDWARPTARFEGGNAESTHEDMVRHWSKFGFVLEEGNKFVEKERAARIP